MSVLGVWMWPETVAAYGAEKVVLYCAWAGITDIFFLAKGLAGTVSFSSSFAPAFSGRDLLKELLNAAQERGIRVHAWFTSACDEHYKALHPESGRYHYVRGRDKGLISLTDEGYLAYMCGIVRELCRNYEIDGLHLDYIRYNHLLYGWDDADLSRYAAAGADLSRLRSLMERTFLQGESNEDSCVFNALREGDPSVRALAEVRRTDVVRFAGRLCGTAREERSGLLLSAALMPEGAYTDTSFADLHYGLSYADAAVLYDFALPMAYSGAYGKNSGWVRDVAEGTLRRGIQTVAGLQAFEGAGGGVLREDISALKDLPLTGICLFRAGSFVLALTQGSETMIVNPLKKPVTSLICGGTPVQLPDPVPAGGKRTVRLPAETEDLRAFADAEELCVYRTDLSDHSH